MRAVPAQEQARAVEKAAHHPRPRGARSRRALEIVLLARRQIIDHRASSPMARPSAETMWLRRTPVYEGGNARVNAGIASHMTEWKKSFDSVAVFTGEFRVDSSFIYDFSHPQDHTLVGTSESGRTNEMQVQQLGIGGDFHHDTVRGRLMMQFGMYSTMTPRNDASPPRGQWNLADAYRY